MPVIVSRNEYGLTRIFILEDRSHGHEVPGIESRHGRMTDGIRDASRCSVPLGYNDGLGST